MKLNDQHVRLYWKSRSCISKVEFAIMNASILIHDYLVYMWKHVFAQLQLYQKCVCRVGKCRIMQSWCMRRVYSETHNIKFTTRNTANTEIWSGKPMFAHIFPFNWVWLIQNWVTCNSKTLIFHVIAEIDNCSWFEHVRITCQINVSI